MGPTHVYRNLLKPLLHILDPERSHDVVLQFTRLAISLPLAKQALSTALAYDHNRLAVTWKNLHFKNPIGLAAGADKNGLIIEAMKALGFGFIEIGTVTPKPQFGNPKPRVFRLPNQQALINNLGFPNRGADWVSHRLERLSANLPPLGINIGKNSSTAIDRAVDDYISCLETLYPYGDYFVVNISSPNTQDLRQLQKKRALNGLLTELYARRRQLANGFPLKPVLLKIAPDLSERDLHNIMEVGTTNGIDGIIAVNTSIDPSLKSPHSQNLPGGISGRPLKKRALEIMTNLRIISPKDFLLIGVGGISDANDAWQMLQAGANLVQIYTSLVYQGPTIVKSMKRDLTKRLQE